MRRRFTILGVPIAALLAVVALTTVQAAAGNVHLKNKPPVSFTDQGLSLSSSGALTGLGNGDIVIALTATGQPVASCTNPSGQNQPAGQNPATVTLSGVQSIPGSAIKNGNVSFNVSTGTPQTPVPGAPECPNPQWTENITDVVFSSATITVYQPCDDTTAPISCPVVFQQTFTL